MRRRRRRISRHWRETWMLLVGAAAAYTVYQMLKSGQLKPPGLTPPTITAMPGQQSGTQPNQPPPSKPTYI